MQYLTFVLGAGASKPYGFPLGDDLVDQIVARTLDHARHIETSAKKRNKTEDRDSLPYEVIEHLQELELRARTLELYAPLSIDRYLDTNYRNDTETLDEYKNILALEMLHCFCHAYFERCFGKKIKKIGYAL